MMRAWILIMCLMLLSGCGFLREENGLWGEFVSGGMVMGRAASGDKVWLNGEELEKTREGWFVFGFGMLEGGDAVLRIGDGEERAYAVERREYEEERIEGLPPRLVRPPPEEWERIKREGALKRAARSRLGLPGRYGECLSWPVEGRVSGRYGSRRTYNGEAGRRHGGVDVAAREGLEVRAPAGGVATLARDDLYFEGGTVFLDHGHGLVSALLHLSRVDVEEGEEVEKGEAVGLVGATGRATGPHVDWRVYWRGRVLDPESALRACAGKGAG